jgi:splicing factor 3B subunit 2
MHSGDVSGSVADPASFYPKHPTNGVHGSQLTHQTPTNDAKLAKNKEKKRRKKKKKKAPIKPKVQETKQEEEEETVDIEYVRQEDDLLNDPAFSHFADIFEHFTRPEELCAPREEEQYEEAGVEPEVLGAPTGVVEGASGSSAAEAAAAALSSATEKKGLSKKQQKRLKRLSIPILKQLVRRPDVVEVHDVNSSDPYFLVYLKAYRNTVPVPRHWSQKRKYLQNKRGIEKPPFQLPEFIAATGISKIRDAYQAKEEQKRLKQKQREKMQPKMGRVDIDYQILHDAFFKYQTKPKLSVQGDLYYECKEFEVQLKEKKPGQLSDELKRALGMPEGAPPPWLINMQRYGPPPSYPHLKIPGLNAPLPTGASYGYHPGGWGKPPVDEYSRPLYGDVFGTAAPAPPPEITAPVERAHWGELEEEPEQEEEEEEEEEEVPAEAPADGTETPAGDGISSVPSGLETPDTIDLRKARKETEEDNTPKQLFTVLEQTATKVGSAAYGSSHKYVIPEGKEKAKEGAVKSKDKVDLIKSQKTEKVDITLNPSEVEDMDTLSDDLLKKKWDQRMQEKADAEKGEDMSDIVAEQARKKRKAASKPSGSSGADKSKKYKDFKF